jgi:hypothetical protein
MSFTPPPPPSAPVRRSGRWVALIVGVVVIVVIGITIPKVISAVSSGSLPGIGSSGAGGVSGDGTSCLQLDTSTWQMDDSDASSGDYYWYGPLVNTCDVALVNITIDGSAYDSTNVQLGTCHTDLNYLDSNGQVTVECDFNGLSDAPASEKVTSSTADKFFTNSCSATIQIDLQAQGDWTLDTSKLSSSSSPASDLSAEVDYSGNIYNSCSFPLSGITVVGVGYDNTGTQIAECTGHVDGSLASKTSAKATCQFQGMYIPVSILSQITTAKVAYVTGTH